jgi:putative Mg2+ transporter-C (MgtC) family protein
LHSRNGRRILKNSLFRRAARPAMNHDLLESLIRMCVAIVAGGLIGWDRQRGGQPAGLRTHMLVALGAGLIVSIAGDGPGDVSRGVQGVATGVGFLCAGEILHPGRDGHERVKGLTSAASLWVTAAIGMVAAAGSWRYVAIGTLGTLVILIAMRPVERVLVKANPESPPTSEPG